MTKNLPAKVAPDLIARHAKDFRDHKKGLPEWVKNAHDSYLRHEVKSSQSFEDIPILLNVDKHSISCLDFGGASGGDMETHIFDYGNPNASSQNIISEKLITTGGHGNGGKYYGIAQFESCEFMSFFNGRFTKISISKKNPWGEEVYLNEGMDFAQAAREAGFNRWEVFDHKSKYGPDVKIPQSKNFFMVRGVKPVDNKMLGARRNVSVLFQQIANHSQSRSPLKSRTVIGLHKGELLYAKLEPETITVDQSFGERTFYVPNELGDLKFNQAGEGILSVKLSAESLTGDKSSLNILDINSKGENIANYFLPDFLGDRSLAKQFAAEIDCPDLKIYDCVDNDREKLSKNEASELFLKWCRERIMEVMGELQQKEKQKANEERMKELKEFVDKVTEEIQDLLEDTLTVPEPSSKGKFKEIIKKLSGDGFGGAGKIKNKGGGKRTGKESESEEKVEHKKQKSQVRLLLSNHDEDPLNPGNRRDLIARDQILVQSIQDIDSGIWWLNTQKSYVSKLDVRSPSGIPFYLSIMKEIIFSHRMRQRFKENTLYDPDGLEELNFELIDTLYGRVTQKLGIELGEQKNISERIRNFINTNDEFTAEEVSTAVGITVPQVHANFQQATIDVKSFFSTEKEMRNGRKINVYKRKI